MSTKANISIDQGTSFSVTLNLTDGSNNVLSLEGYDAFAQMKRWYSSNNVTTFDTTINTTAGTITLELDANTTGNLHAGRHVFDVDISDGNTVTRLVEGLVHVSPRVTTISSNGG